MALVLSVRQGEEVFVNDTPSVVSLITHGRAVLATAGQLVEVTCDRWERLSPNCEVRLSQQGNSLARTRIQFNAPTAKVLRGSAYRNPDRNKKGIQP